MPRSYWLILLLLGVSLGFAAGPAVGESTPPKLLREFRGAWIATVGNIDWPSKPGLSVAEQKAELRNLMDHAARLHLNALILQVRPGCDAFYKSSLDPWSEYLTGKMGDAPEPFYDPLQFAVEEAHARALELHAWFNPYRAGFLTRKYTSPKHISKTHPKWVHHYGSVVWLDPSEPGVQDYVSRVILDVVRRYDIDGVHLDDYFYPYPETNRAGVFLEFPDDANWKKYQASGGRQSRAGWRRQNVNRLVQRLQREIHQEKSWVTFGISPFGIWRPGFPQQVKGFDPYERLYADSRSWLANGWVDYLAPQLYWRIDSREQSFSALLDWWENQSTRQKPVWPGGADTRVGKAWPPEEIVRQIQLTRETSRPGYIHWNISSLVANPGNLDRMLLDKVYSAPALVPSNVETAATSQKPILTAEPKKDWRVVRWSLAAGQKVNTWVVQAKFGNEWISEVLPARLTAKEFPGNRMPTVVAVSALDRNRQLGPPSLLAIKP
jgi:uncharacterized lipoprotein YddW (UPF0748 family)